MWGGCLQFSARVSGRVTDRPVGFLCLSGPVQGSERHSEPVGFVSLVDHQAADRFLGTMQGLDRFSIRYSGAIVWLMISAMLSGWDGSELVGFSRSTKGYHDLRGAPVRWCIGLGATTW